MKHKTNLLAIIRKWRKPKSKPPTQTEIILMSKLLDLVARVKMLTASHAELKSANLAYVAKIAELTAEAIAADAKYDELMAAIDGELDAGGSMGGVVA